MVRGKLVIGCYSIDSTDIYVTHFLSKWFMIVVEVLIALNLGYSIWSITCYT